MFLALSSALPISWHLGMINEHGQHWWYCVVLNRSAVCRIGAGVSAATGLYQGIQLSAAIGHNSA